MAARPGPRLTVRERILVHLAEATTSEHEAEAPLGVTQTGIARTVFIEQRHVAQYVRPMVREGLVLERMAHIRGGKQRRRAYFLTTQGKIEARRLRAKLLGTQIVVEGEYGPRAMTLGEAAKGPLKGSSLLEALKTVGKGRPVEAQISPPGASVISPEEIVIPVDGVAHLAPPGPPLVGRTREMERLRQALDQLERGRGGCVMLVGKAGIGKSRLAFELSTLASQRGIPFFTGQATEYGGAPPFSPWTEALRALAISTPPPLLRNLAGSHASVLAGILPDLPARIGLAPPDRAAPTNFEKFQLFEAVTQFLRRASMVTPLIVFLDDLQWADEATTQLLAYVSRNAASERILFLGSFRPEDVVRDGPLDATLLEMERRRQLERVELLRLPPKDVQDLMVALLEADQIDEKLTSMVVKRAAGNPFFTEELVTSMREEGRIAVRGGEATWSGGAAHLPASVHRLIRRRLARFDERTQELLLRASVLGLRIPSDVLSAISGLGSDALIDAVDEALEGGFLIEDPQTSDGDLRFSDELMRDCLYESLSETRRRSYHRRAAESLGAQPLPSAEELGYHYAEARLPELAKKYLEVAGDEAMAKAAYGRAAERFDRALAFTPEEHGEAHRRLLVKLGNAYSTSGRLGKAKEAYLRARAYPAPNKKEEASLRVSLAEVLMDLWDATAVKQELEGALLILQDDRSSDAARAFNLLSNMHHSMEGDAQGSLRASEQALAIAEAIGDKAEAARALDELLYANAALGRWQAVEAYASRLLSALAAGLEKPDLEGSAYNDLAIIYLISMPDYPKGLECVSRGFEIARRVGNHRMATLLQMRRAQGFFLMGRWGEAEVEANTALAMARESEDCKNFVAPFFLPALLKAGRGDLQVAERSLLAALSAQEWHEEVRNRLRAYWILAWIRAEGGDMAGAREAITSARELAGGYPDSGWFQTPVQMAIVHVESMGGDVAAFEAAIKWVEERGNPSDRATVAASKGRWRRLHGTPSEEELAEAEEFWRRVGNPFELATVLLEHALTLQALNMKDRAAPILEEALQTYSALGARKRVEDLLRTQALLGA